MNGSKPGRKTFIFLGLILVIIALMRFVGLYNTPAFEWDEGVYGQVGLHLFTVGQLMTKNQIVTPNEYYLYHPFFYFYIISGWFHITQPILNLPITIEGIIESDRIFAAICSLIMLMMLWYFLTYQQKMGEWAIIPTLLLGFDAWLQYTARVSWIENSMMLIGVLAIMVYQKALDKGTWKWFLLAGFLFGAVAVYKHVGLYFLGIPIISLVILRKYFLKHVVLMAMITLVGLLFVLIMLKQYPDQYINQVLVQIRRTIGTQQARGTPTSLSVYWETVKSQYIIFLPTILCALSSIPIFIVGALKSVKRIGQKIGNWSGKLIYKPAKPVEPVFEPFADHPVLVSWVISAFIFFGLIKLRMPHYFLMLFIPMFCYVGYIVARYLSKQNPQRLKTFGLYWLISFDKLETAKMPAITTKLVTQSSWKKFIGQSTIILLMATVLLNGFVSYPMRIVVSHGDALRSTAQYLNEVTKPDDIIVTEESIGVLINRPYCKLVSISNPVCTGFAWMVIYLSTTQVPPDNPCIAKVENPLNSVLIKTFTGFKEEIKIYKVNPNFTCSPHI